MRESRLCKVISNIYFLLIINILSILSLVISNWTVTLFPTIFTVIYLFNLFLNKKLNSYDPIIKIYLKTFLKVFKENCFFSLFIGLFTSGLFSILQITSNVNSKALVVVRIFVIYFIIMGFVYLNYVALIKCNNLNKKSLFKAVAVMFYKPVIMITMVASVIVIYFSSIYSRYIVLTCGFSLYALNFVYMNRNTLVLMKPLIDKCEN